MEDYVAPSYYEQLINNFLEYVAKEHKGVLVNIGQADIIARTGYKFLNHDDVVKGYFNNKEKDND